MEITNEELLNKYIGSYVVAIEDLSPAPPQETRLRAREAHNKFHDELLQRLNRQNANLAGMEPRCPKCGNLNFSVAMVGRDNQIGTCGKCDCNLPVAQFFRSPAPTPPLDVEAEKRIAEIRERESKATKGPWFWRKCYEIGRRHWAIKSPESEADGRVVGVMGTLAFDDFTPPDKWHADPNNQFIAHARLDIPFLLEQISLLRRHIASPAPQSSRTYGDLPGSIRNMVEPHEWDNKNISEQRDYALDMVDFLERELGNFRRNQALAASPAQPEKRDEWVSVDERLPKADSQVPELSERVDFFAPGMIGERRFQRGRIKYGHCWRSATGDGEFDLAEVTHWQPLPAPPQSGKEGQ